MMTSWQDPNPPATTDSGHNTALIVAGAVLTLVVAAVLVAAVIFAPRNSDGDASARVVLMPSNAPGPDPFTPSLVVTPTRLSGSAPSQLTAVAGQLPVSAQRGVRLASGLQPGLYGGAPQSNSCDAAALANYLDADADLAVSWSATLGLQRADTPYYLNTLTPVILLNDSWVTSHALADGRASPFQTVLQAGSAVLIDPAGVPRVHCASGAPLLPPAPDTLTHMTVDGDAWPSYDTQDVVAVSYTDPAASPEPVTEFDLLDVSSAEPFSRPVGGTINIDAAPDRGLPDPAAMNVPPPIAGS